LSQLPGLTVSPEDIDARTFAEAIEAGPVTIHDYMRFANNAYYNRKDPLGADGDFITAPEISQVFGEMVGIWLTDIWLRNDKPQRCHYVELGPGRGTLAADAVRTMRRFGLEPQVHFVENSVALRTLQMQAVPHAKQHQTVASLPDDEPLLVVANEFFDALPIQQMIKTDAGWRERVVVREHNARFAPLPGATATDGLVPSALRVASVGSIFESCPDAESIMHDISLRLSRQGGAVLAIDYGYTQSALGSSLQAVKNHVYADPFADVGQCDLTAHVDFSKLADVARAAGLSVAGPVDQGHWLSALGVRERGEKLLHSHPDRAADIAAGVHRLVHPDAMGSLFKVMSAYAPDWPAPEGFGT
jgi:NADH dehydrogenase [ubiquinone] 1 alpha subcomplex assembly factor 7